MVKLDIKSLIIGLIVGGISVSSAFLLVQKSKANTYTEKNVSCTSTSSLEDSTQSETQPQNETNTKTEAQKQDESKAQTASLNEGIESAKISDTKAYFNGQLMYLKKPLVTIKENSNSLDELYMSVDEILKFMNFDVQWNKDDNSLYLNIGLNNAPFDTQDLPPNISANESDSKAIEIIQKTGNWNYVEKYLPTMSEDGIRQVIDIYNSKHPNEAEHKNASDYLHK